MVQIWDKPLLLTRVIPTLEELLSRKQVEVQVPAGPIGFGMAMDFLSMLRPLIPQPRCYVELALAGLRRPACTGSPQAEYNIKFVSADLVMNEETPALLSTTLSCGRDDITARLISLTKYERASAMGAHWDLLTNLQYHMPATLLTRRLELLHGRKAIKTNLRFYEPAGLATQPTINISQVLYETIRHGVG